MAVEQFTNDAAGTVSSGGTTAPGSGTSESWTVSVTTAFPVAAVNATKFHVADPALPSELMLVTVAPGGTGGSQSWTVTRGAESTTPVAHAAGFAIQQVVAAGWLNAAQPMLTPIVEAANYTAHPGDLVLVDTTSSNITVTLPTAPVDKAVIGVLIYKQPGSNTATAAAGGADTFNDTGGTTKNLKTLFELKVWQYDAALTTWVATAGNLDLSQLDNRYLYIVATTGTTGYTLVNGTGNILTWTAPSDGNLHRVVLFADLDVSSGTTGGAIQLTYTNQAGDSQSVTELSGTQSGGAHRAFDGMLVKAGTTVTLAQSSAMTGGAATLTAEIWGN